MTVHILLFGHYRDYLPVTASPSCVAASHSTYPTAQRPPIAAARLAERDARFADLPARARVAVRAEFAGWDTPTRRWR